MDQFITFCVDVISFRCVSITFCMRESYVTPTAKRTSTLSRLHPPPMNGNVKDLVVLKATKTLSSSFHSLSLSVECPAGSYYNKDSQSCQNCQEGTFQNKSGQMACEPCPAGTWSVGGHAKNFTECYGKSNRL